MYLQEKYKDIVYYIPFSRMTVMLDKNITALAFNFGKDKNLFWIYEDHLHLFIDSEKNVNGEEEYGKYIKKLKKTNKRFLMFSLSIYIIDKEFSHAVSLLYDKFTNELEFFQRNPSKYSYKPYEEVKKIVLSFFKNVFGKKVKPVYNNNLCIKAYYISGFCSGAHFELYKNLDGDCMIWSLWYLELRLKNRDIPRRQILNRAIRTFTKSLKKYDPDVNLACRVILGYRKFIDDFVEQFEVVKSSKGSYLRINKKKSTPLLKKAERLLKTYLFLLGKKYS